MTTTPTTPPMATPQPPDLPADAAVPAAPAGPPAETAATPPQAEPAALPAVQAVEVATADAPAAEAPAAAATDPDGTAAAPVPAALDPAAVGVMLKQRFPGLFAGAPKPIKLHIQADIQARAPGLFSRRVLSAFLHRHTGSTSYLMALSKGRQRFDLDGQPAGDLADEHREAALQELARRRTLHDERRTREAQERELAEQQRFNRAGLLRDFERTTLTLANFCVLKGVAADELDGLLAMARRERDEAPPPPPRDDRRPRPGAGGDRRPAGDRPPRGDRAPQGQRPPRGDRPARTGDDRPRRPPPDRR